WLLVVALAALLTWGWPAPPWWRVLARQWRLVAAGAALVVIGLDTRLLTVPFGLQAGLIDPLWRWPASVALDPEPRQLMLLLTVEAALLFASLAGATRWLRPKTEPFGAFLALWLALALLLALAQSDAP